MPPGSHPLWGVPGSLTFRAPRSANVRGRHEVTLRLRGKRGLCPPGGHPYTFQVARGLMPEGDRVFRVGTAFQPLHFAPCNCVSLWPFPDLLLYLSFSSVGPVSLRCSFPYSTPPTKGPGPVSS